MNGEENQTVEQKDQNSVNLIKTKVANLINVKTIITTTLTLVFSILALRGKIAPEQFVTIFTVIIGFYFGTQKQKADDEKGKKL